MNRPALDTYVPGSALSCRRPSLADGARIHALVDECKPLDLNSPYAYLLLSTHFADTCAIAEQEGDVLAFLAGYLKPGDPSVIFIWQIAVSPRARRRGLGKRLLREVLSRPECRTARSLETTITPSNKASWELFHSFARDLRAACHEAPIFSEADFGGGPHEAEQLLRIGPLPGQIGSI